MRYAAIAILCVVGLIELVVRFVFMIFLVCSILGLMLFDDDGNDWLIKPTVFGFVSRLIDQGQNQSKTMVTLARENERLEMEKRELQHLLVMEDARARYAR